MKKAILTVSLFSILLASDQIPSAPQTFPILLKNATIHPVSSGIIRDGQLLFEKGKIVYIGKDIEILPDNTKTINLEKKHIYPGLIAAGTTLGLVEINAVRSTRDFEEVGEINPNVRTEVSYNPDSELIPVTRSNGITIAHIIPTGGIISGTSAAMMLDGWTWETATLKSPIALHMNWPEKIVAQSLMEAKSKKEKQEEISKRIHQIDEIFDQARSYLQTKELSERKAEPLYHADLRWESIIPVLKNEVPIFIHADEVEQIEAAVQWSIRQKVTSVIVGGHDAWRVAELLKKYNIPVIYENVQSLPLRRWEDYDIRFTTPWKLYREGIKFCISASSSPSQAAHQRNVPYHAATAAAYGLPRNEALKAITLYAAEILGISDFVGSLETGKDATLFITDGDPLEISSQVEMMFIQGKRIDLGDKHKTLYKKYQEKYRQLGFIK